MLDHLIVLSGAGISAESGLATFRDADGLWERHSIDDVATPQAFARNPERVLNFYNARREQLHRAEPNAGHRALADLERHFRVTIITQNIDDLHERAGSSRVLHLHGELTKARSVADPERLYPIGYEAIALGDLGDDGTQLRPHVVWFGELVPLIDEAAALMPTADRVLVVGTSLQVYPAAGLVDLVTPGVPVTVIDPSAPTHIGGAEILREPASIGVPLWVKRLVC
ncbi:SIR2 family NAD-dependent protein deacylase [Marinimicrobium alkaliphilum]|uniref:SIR2 family NAD-dependent protein deacylase n=1 Tax=Marinimicrobium alkaliphilum TaxID=2202654 RepID=UPI000DBA7675|nr:NAD-dependent deacylase [Marinimicrobium alkaliphilum]